MSALVFDHVCHFAGSDPAIPLFGFVFLVALGVDYNIFLALGTLPVVLATEIGFVVAFGVLLDTFVVRSVLVSALNLDLGRWLWWPSGLYRRPDVDLNELDDDQAPVLTT